MKAVIIALGPAYSQAARSVYYFDFRPPQISVFVYRRYEHASFYSRLCTLFVCLAICGAISLPIAAQHTVVGVVFDNSTGGPLPGSNVRVRLSDYGTVTDASGRFEIFDVPSGRLQIRASRQMPGSLMRYWLRQIGQGLLLLRKRLSRQLLLRSCQSDECPPFSRSEIFCASCSNYPE